MYLTAHRAQDPDSKQTAIHVFLHVHEEAELFEVGLSGSALLKRVTEAEPGRLVDKKLELLPGGNAVLSYVDVVTPDGTSKSEVLDALARFGALVASGPNPLFHRYGSVVVSFGAVFGLEGVEQREYDNLCEGLAPLIERFYNRAGL